MSPCLNQAKWAGTPSACLSQAKSYPFALWLFLHNLLLKFSMVKQADVILELERTKATTLSLRHKKAVTGTEWPTDCDEQL